MEDAPENRKSIEALRAERKADIETLVAERDKPGTSQERRDEINDDLQALCSSDPKYLG